MGKSIRQKRVKETHLFSLAFSLTYGDTTGCGGGGSSGSVGQEQGQQDEEKEEGN